MNVPRRPWLAALLTIVTLGLGHLYTGRAKRGFSLFILGSLIIGVFISLSFLFPPPGLLIGIFAGLSFAIYCIIDAYKIAKDNRNHYILKRYNRWYFYLLFYLICSVLLGSIVERTVKANIAQAYKIPAGSMLETLQIGDHIICNKLVFKLSDPKRGDVVIFPYPKDPSVDYVKRIVGLGGETIEIKDKHVFINGNLLSEPYVRYTSDTINPASPRDNMGTISIPDNMMFLMGDNRDNSHDSRFWGFVDRSEIKGKVTYVYWSWDSGESRVNWHRIGRKVE